MLPTQKIIRHLYYFIFPLLIISCRSNGPSEIYSHPEKLRSHHLQYSRIIVAAISNFNSQLTPLQEDYHPNGSTNPISFQVGGKEVLSKYLKVLKSEFENETLLLSTGTIFKPNANKQDQVDTLLMLNDLDFDAIAYLPYKFNHESSDLIMERFSEIPFVNTNGIELKTNKKGQRPNTKVRMVTKNGINIGILSVDLISPPSKKYDKLPLVSQEDPVLSILKAKKILKERDVTFTILLANLKSQCSVSLEKILQNPNKTQELNCYNPTDQLTELISRLPPDTIHLIVTSNSSLATGSIRNIPILQAQNQGAFITWGEFRFNPKTRQLIDENSHLRLPIKTCHYFFRPTSDCYVRKEWLNSSSGDVKMIMKLSNDQIAPASFLGKEISL